MALSKVRPDRRQLGFLVGMLAAAGAQAAGPAVEVQGTTGWEHEITPYIWFSGMSGRAVVATPLGPLEAKVDASFSDVLNSLEIGGMVSYRGQRGNWNLLGDAVYMDLEANEASAGQIVTTDSQLSIKQMMLEADVGYRLTDALVVFAGARFNDIDADLRVDSSTSGGTTTRTGDSGATWVDPVIGLLGEYPLTDKWAFNLRGDIGGFGVGSEFTWQVMGSVVWSIRENLQLSATYRYLVADYEDEGSDELQVYKMTVMGPGIGLTFRF